MHSMYAINCFILHFIICFLYYKTIFYDAVILLDEVEEVGNNNKYKIKDKLKTK